MSLLSTGAAAAEDGGDQTQQGGTGGDGQPQQTQTQTQTQQTQGGAGEQTQQTQTQGSDQTTQTQTQQTQGGEWLPEEYRNDPAFGKFKTLGDLCKSQKHLQGLLGKKTVARPDENSTEEEWAQWWRDNGVPDDGKDYELSPVAEMPQEWFADDVVQVYRDAFKQANIPVESAKKLWEIRNKFLQDQVAARAAQIKARNEAEAAKLRQEWGDDYAKNFNKAAAAFQKLFPGVDISESPLCNDPVFIKGMLRAYDAVKDDTMPDATAPVASALSAVEERISTILNSPGYQNAQNPDHARLVQEMVELQRRKAQLKKSIK